MNNPERQTHDVVIDCFKSACEAALVAPYSTEKEIQWYTSYRLTQATGMSIVREEQTRCAYYTDEARLLVRTDGPVQGRKRSRGYIDIVCHGTQQWAIEIKCPLGQGQAEYYNVSIRRDLQKLHDMDYVDRKYFLCLIGAPFQGQFRSELNRCREEGLLDGITDHVEVFST